MSQNYYEFLFSLSNLVSHGQKVGDIKVLYYFVSIYRDLVFSL